MPSMRIRTGLMAMVTALVIGLGCDQPKSDVPAVDLTKIQVSVVDSLQNILPQHTGDVVLVDYWATW